MRERESESAQKIIVRVRHKNEIQFPTMMLMAYVLFTQIAASAMTLKGNQIINGQFSQPKLTGMMGFYNWTIPGWNCSWLCQLNNCQIFQRVNVGYNLIFNDCEGQVIDLNSIGKNEVVTQGLQLKAGHFLLSFDYYYPIYNANKKIIYVYFNQQLKFEFKPPSACRYQKFNKEIPVEARQGYNNLTFTMAGPAGDGSGFNLNNISLSRIEDTFFEEFVNTSLQNSFITNLISVPAYRTLFGEVANFFVGLDRLQLYFYHKRNYSYCWELFLYNVNELMALKGTFVQNKLDFIMGQAINASASFLETLNFKEKYADGDGFLMNNSSVVIYSLPFIICLVVGGYFAFLMLFSEPVSRLLRKYSMLGIIIFCIFDGNIQQFTYYIWGEFLYFCSFSVPHKLVNIFILFSFFLTIFTALASFLWFRVYYRHLVSYFLDNNKPKLSGLLSTTVDRGIFCLLLGSIHRLLLNSPDLQLAVLGLTELLWIFSRCLFLAWSANTSSLAVFLGIFGSLLRMLFQLSSLAYSLSGEIFLNEFVHKHIIYIFLFSWGCQFLLSFCTLLSELPTYFRQKIHKNTRSNEQNSSRVISYKKGMFNIYQKAKKQLKKDDDRAYRETNKCGSVKPPQNGYDPIKRGRERAINNIKKKRELIAMGCKPKFSIY